MGPNFHSPAAHICVSALNPAKLFSIRKFDSSPTPHLAKYGKLWTLEARNILFSMTGGLHQAVMSSLHKERI